jgi:hypothetical protein
VGRDREPTGPTLGNLRLRPRSTVLRPGARSERNGDQADGASDAALDATSAAGWSETQHLVSVVRHESGQPDCAVQFTPINVAGRLVHCKGYSLTRRGRAGQVGFVVITSGNLTGPGLGLDERSNVELAQVSSEMGEIEAFQTAVAYLVGTHALDERKIQVQERDFLLGLRVLGRGAFYRDGNRPLGAEAAFKVVLTEKGKARRKEFAHLTEFGPFDKDAASFSLDPLNMAGVFKKVSRPFSRTFWKNHSLKTLLGQWVVPGVANLVEEILGQDVAPYMQEIKRRSAEGVLSQKALELRKEVEQLRAKELIETKVDSVDTWVAKVRAFRGNEDLVREIVFDRHRVPDPLDAQNRRLVLETIKDIRVQFALAKVPSRTQREIKALLDNGGSGIDRAFESLTNAARSASSEWKEKQAKARKLEFKMPSQEAILAILPRIRDFFDIDGPNTPRRNDK